MNPVQPEPTFDESVKQVMQTLPSVVRTYLSQGKYTIVAKSMMTKYGLRIDQGGVLEREIMLLLMGIESPTEFMQTLAEEARLDQKVITSIVQDINAQIFVPLREEERRGGEGSLTPTAPIVSMQASAQPTSHFHLQNKITPPARAIQTPFSVKPLVSVLQGNPPARFAQSPRPNMIAAPSPAASNTLLEDHEEPHIEFNKASATSTPVSAQKAPVPQSPLGEVLSRIIPPGGRPAFAPAPKTVFPTSVPPRVIPPQTPSGAISSTVAPQFNQLPSVPKPTASAVPAPVVPKVPLTPSKPYSTDPYREPIDEK
ncbi:MAG: hypothetical protein NT108_01310 [Candidatus Kaiserbacteria bacterium]|nr:hypothetical protein [Candidatus Kaiserbacteria bacterium]